jgi:hypothetical protein
MESGLALEQAKVLLSEVVFAVQLKPRQYGYVTGVPMHLLTHNQIHISTHHKRQA